MEVWPGSTYKCFALVVAAVLTSGFQRILYVLTLSNIILSSFPFHNVCIANTFSMSPEAKKKLTG